jgi:O-antigen/teichoic acid export membrane protein
VRVARNTAISGARTLIRLLVGFALLPLMLHGIGSTRTGLFLFATTLTGYFTAIDISVTSSVTRYVAEHRARNEAAQLAATVRSSLLVMAGFGLLTGLILAIVALTAAHALFGEAVLRRTAEPTILVAALTSALYWPSRVGVAAVNGIERYDQSAMIQIATSVVMLGVIGWLAHEHASVTALTAVFGAVSVSEGFISAALAWRPLGIDRRWLEGRWWGGEQLRGVFRFGAAAFLIGISDTMINSFDRAVVGAIVGAAAIVGYDVAQRPQSAVSTISDLAGLALVSPVARLGAESRHARMRDLVLIASFVSVVVTAPVAVLAMVLARPFVQAWLGHGYAHYAPYVVIFISYWALNCATSALSSALYGIGQLRTYAQIIFATAVVSLPLSVGLTFAWGTVGVIWGTVIPSVVAMPVFIVCALRLLEIEPGAFWRGVLLPGFGTVAAWSAVVVVSKLALDPNGYPGLIAFGAVALAVVWAAFTPMTLRRIRAVRGLTVAA